MDTRNNVGASGPVASGSTVTLSVLGQGGVPTTGVSAVVLNVTATAPTAGGHVIVYPDGTTAPSTSNVNWVAGDTIADLTMSKVGANGKIAFKVGGSGTVHLLADVTGYYTTGTATTGGAFVPLTAARLMDTRSNVGATGPLANGSTTSLTVAGQGGIPTSGVSAIVVNLTATQGTTAGSGTLFAGGTTEPTASNLNWAASQNVSNLAIVQVGSNGKISVAAHGPTGGTAHLILDVSGYYTSGSSGAGTYVPVAPTRVLDTRYGTGATGPVAANATVAVSVLGKAGIPADGVSAVVVNLTATQGTASGYLTVYASGGALPATSNVNYQANESVAGLAVTKVGADGKLAFKNVSGGTVNMIADVAGYFTAPDASPDQPSSFSIFPCDTSCSAEPWGTSSLLPDLQAKVSDTDSPTLTAVFTVQDSAGATVATGSDVVNSGEVASFSFPADQPLSPGKTYKFNVTAKDATSSTVSGWHTFTTAADASTAALALAEPLTLHGTGATLRWTPYRNTSGDPDLGLAEYQVFRGPTTVASYTPGNAALKLAGTVPADQTTFTDTTAAPAAAYRYWVVARTDADVKVNRDAQAGLALNSNPRDVTLPSTGQTTQVLIGTTPAKAGDPITDVRDATLSSKTPTASSTSLRPGTVDPAAETTVDTRRGLIAFDTDGIDLGRRVMAATLTFNQVGGGPSTATTARGYDVYQLAKDFSDTQANWTKASATITWSAAGGDLTGPVLGSFQAAGAGASVASPRGLSVTSTAAPALRSAVQDWVSDHAKNHGLLLKANNEALAPGQWLELAATESTAQSSSDTLLRPRLTVTYLDTPDSETFQAPTLPQRFVPGTTVKVPVTVTNTSADTWTGLQLAYRWTLPKSTTDVDSSNSDNNSATVPTLAPGASATVQLPVKTPINSDTGSNGARTLNDLYLDLQDTTTKAWWSADATHAYVSAPAALSDAQRAEGLCRMVTTGLACPDRASQSPTSDGLGVEDFNTVTGTATGNGSTALVNLNDGNLAWTYSAFANPSLGPSAFLRVSYNSLDKTNSSGGQGWSIQPATLNRLGSPLVQTGNGSSNNDSVTLTDGDGTTHRWTWDTSASAYRRPAGLHWDLKTNPAATSDKYFEFTRPDGTHTYFYGFADNKQPMGLPSAIQDPYGNTLTFNYTIAGPNKYQLTALTDASARTVATLGYTSTGQLRYVRDISGRAVEIGYNDLNPAQVTSIRDGGSYTPDPAGAPGTYSQTAKSFSFGYPSASNPTLTRVTDPRGSSTSFEYYAASDTTADGTPLWSAATGWVKSLTDRRGLRTDIIYVDGDSGTDPDSGEVEARTIDNVGDGQPNRVSKLRSDAFGRTLSAADANGNITRLGWDGDHNVTQLTEANGATRRWQFDPASGYPLRQWDAEAVAGGSNPTVMTYKDTTAPTGVGRTVLETLTSPLGNKSVFGYDTGGSLTSVTDPEGNATTYAYNTDGTLATAKDPRGNTTTYTYATNGKVVGQPSTVTPPLDAPVTASYDARGAVLSTTQTGAGQTLTSSAVYDVFGAPTTVTTPGAQGGTRTTTTTYDNNGNVATSTAPNGAVTSTTYAADDLPTTIAIPDNNGSGRTLGYTFNKLGQILTETDPRSQTTSYSYDLVGQLLTTSRPDDSASPVTTTFAYDKVGNQTKATDPLNHTIEQQYDLNHRVTAVIDALGYATRARYDADGRTVSTVDARGVTRTSAYDKAGRVVASTVPYTPVGSTTTQTWTSRYEYDKGGNTTAVTDPKGNKSLTVYDALNRPTQTQSATATLTDRHYDALGRLDWVSDPYLTGGAVTKTAYTYHPSGQIKTATDPWNITTSYEYDATGAQTSRQLSNATDSLTRTQTWGYWPDGSLAWRDDTGSNDGSLPIVTVDNSAATVTGTWTTRTTPDGQTGTNYLTHAAGSTDTVAWTLTPTKAGSYQVQVSCPKPPASAGALTTSAPYTFAHGTTDTATLNQATSCNGHSWRTLGTYTLAAGAATTLKVTSAASGLTVADAARLIPSSTGTEFAYTYDANGNQTQVNDNTPAGSSGARVTAYQSTYDPLDRVKKVTDLAGTSVLRATDYTYNRDSTVATVAATRAAQTAPAGRDGDGNLATTQTTTYTYDARRAVASVKANITAGTGTNDIREWKYTYDPAGQLLTLTKPNASTGSGNTTSYAYYEPGLLKSSAEKLADGTTLVASHIRSYEATGDPIRDQARIDNTTGGYLDQTSTFTYAPDRKLKSVVKSGNNDGQDETYTYDAAGNIKTQTVSGKATTYSYDRNRLTSAASGGVTGTYNYDGLGRLTSITGGGASTTYTYDGFDRTTKVASTGGTATSETTSYDPLDRPTLQTKMVGATSTKTRYNYLGLTKVTTAEEQTTTAGAWQIAKAYTRDPAGGLLSLVDTPVNGGTAKTRYYSTSPHGDVELLTDPTTGKATSTYRYTAYGSEDPVGTVGEDKTANDVAKDASPLNPYRYSSKRYSGLTKSYDMGFRTYSPITNRFLTRDMFNGALGDMALATDPWNVNRYALAGGNPVSRSELDGHINAMDDETDGSSYSDADVNRERAAADVELMASRLDSDRASVTRDVSAGASPEQAASGLAAVAWWTRQEHSTIYQKDGNWFTRGSDSPLLPQDIAWWYAQGGDINPNAGMFDAAGGSAVADVAMGSAGALHGGVRALKSVVPRFANGRYAPRNGEQGRDGAVDEANAWDHLAHDGAAVDRKETPVSAPGRGVRKYDGTVQIQGQWYGIETKGGTSPLTPHQRQFDEWLNIPGNTVTTSDGRTLIGTFNVWVVR